MIVSTAIYPARTVTEDSGIDGPTASRDGRGRCPCVCLAWSQVSLTSPWNGSLAAGWSPGLKPLPLIQIRQSASLRSEVRDSKTVYDLTPVSGYRLGFRTGRDRA